MKDFKFLIYSTTKTLPKEWDTVARANYLLQSNYLSILETSAPSNMMCYYVGVFENEQLIATLLTQYIDLNALQSFGERDSFFKKTIRNFIFKNFASHALFVGNNMITGSNSYCFSKIVTNEELSYILKQTAIEVTSFLKNEGIKIHIVSFKDFYEPIALALKEHDFKTIYEFNAQPNMVFQFDKNWTSKNDYIVALTKKYRDQYKRSHKKASELDFQELNLQQVISLEARLHELYMHVANHAPFNTFYLTENHFSALKRECTDHFKIFGYFLDEKLVGFFTVLMNDRVLETYFLGYDEAIQKEKMMYLNMLYTIIEIGIEKKVSKIIFGRTALEIKSSVGAQPVKMSGFIYHTNSFLNRFMAPIFKRMEPEVVWQQRHPFS